MWGTSSPDDKLTCDLANVIEAISIDDRGSNCLAAEKLAPGNLGLFQQHRSKPEITAPHHWHPLQPDQQTLRVRTLYAQHVELAFNVAEYEIGARHHRGPPSPSVAFSAP